MNKMIDSKMRTEEKEHLKEQKPSEPQNIEMMEGREWKDLMKYQKANKAKLTCFALGRSS